MYSTVEMENQDDVLSFMGSDHENDIDILELYSNQPRIRSVTEDSSTVVTNKRPRGVKRADLMFSKCTATTGRQDSFKSPKLSLNVLKSLMLTNSKII